MDDSIILANINRFVNKFELKCNYVNIGSLLNSCICRGKRLKRFCSGEFYYWYVIKCSLHFDFGRRECLSGRT